MNARDIIKLAAQLYCSSGRNKNPPALAVGSVKRLWTLRKTLSCVTSRPMQ